MKEGHYCYQCAKEFVGPPWFEYGLCSRECARLFYDVFTAQVPL